jgi:hypothetical protein
MNVRVKQEGVAEYNADDRNRVGDTQNCNYSGAITKPKESVQMS